MTTADLARRTRTRSPLFVSLALASAILATGALGHAQGGDKVLAESLFQAGKSLMAEGKYDQACPKFVESQKQDPSPGTLLNLGKCHEAQGKTASAWAEYTEAAAMARAMGRAEQETAANERATALEPKLSKLKIDAPPSEIAGLTVKRDGAPTGTSSLGIAIPVDPGDHAIEASAPGYKTWTGKITVGKDGDQKTIAIPALEKGEDPAAGGAPPSTGTGSAPNEYAADTGGGGSSRKTIGFAVAGAGVVFIGLGAVFGLMASSQASSAEDDKTLCPNKQCTKAGRDEIDGAETKALISTIGFAAGVVAVGAGVVLIVTAPKKTASAGAARYASITPAVGPTGGGAMLTGSF